MAGEQMMVEAKRYRAVTIDELPELKRVIRGLEEPFRVADIVPRLPAGMRGIEPRELGRALVQRGLCESVGYDPETRSALLIMKESNNMRQTSGRKRWEGMGE